MMIGKFKADEEGGYEGELNALGLSVDPMTFRPVKDKQGDGPDFIVIGYGEFPDDFEDVAKLPPPSLDGFIIPNTNTYLRGRGGVEKGEPERQALFIREAGRPDIGGPVSLPPDRAQRRFL
jgi:hypothetical protein